MEGRGHPRGEMGWSPALKAGGSATGQGGLADYEPAGEIAWLNLGR